MVRFRPVLGRIQSESVLGTASDGPGALAQVQASRPDVLVTDIEMPGLSGLDVAEQLRVSCPAVRLVIVTTFGRAGYLRRALDVGARGCLLKDTPASELAGAIRRMHAGGQAIDPTLAAEAWADSDPLSARERQVLRAVETGASTAAAAALLGLSEGTVRNYLSEAMGKLGARKPPAPRATRGGWL